ncbi:unnamed protein product [Thelazia callipaeda]|uniref:Protein-tyrosine-phosphatase n=1 Tax=Thelazia callipaeda TaxID=103827 RepID=A0A0N5DBI2_THECL|nr:unnamed protein product [Thelazia callipaeda]
MCRNHGGANLESANVFGIPTASTSSVGNIQSVGAATHMNTMLTNAAGLAVTAAAFDSTALYQAQASTLAQGMTAQEYASVMPTYSTALSAYNQYPYPSSNNLANGTLPTYYTSNYMNPTNQTYSNFGVATGISPLASATNRSTSTIPSNPLISTTNAGSSSSTSAAVSSSLAQISPNCRSSRVTFNEQTQQELSGTTSKSSQIKEERDEDIVDSKGANRRTEIKIASGSQKKQQPDMASSPPSEAETNATIDHAVSSTTSLQLTRSQPQQLMQSIQSSTADSLSTSTVSSQPTSVISAVGTVPMSPYANQYPSFGLYSNGAMTAVHPELSQTALPTLTPSAFRIGSLIDNYSMYNNMYAAQPSNSLSDYPYQQTLYR